MTRKVWRAAYLSLLLTGAGLVPVTTTALAAPSAGEPEVPLNGKVIVKFRPGAASAAGQERVVRQVGADHDQPLRIQRRLGTGAALVTGANPEDASAIAAEFDRRPDVDYAEPDRLMVPSDVPQEPGRDDPGIAGAWNLQPNPGIDVTSAWRTTTGTGVVVAVIDTGILDHPDLAGQSVPGYDFVTDPTMGGDGDGRDADPSDPGNYCATGTNLSSWHGTHVAGIIAALAGNGIGVTGIAPTAKILPVRALGRCGGWMSDVADGVIWAAGAPVAGTPTNTNPAHVINLSFGGIGSCSITEQSAIAVARGFGAVVVTAAGNDAANASLRSPGNCRDVINVAATDGVGRLASYSNHGPAVTLAAPGSGILSTWNAGSRDPGAMTYALRSGTSMAAPHVSAVAALLKSVVPDATPDEVRAALVLTANPPLGKCVGCGAGIVDARSAVRAFAGLRAPVVDEVSPASGPVAGGGVVTLTGSRLASVTGVAFGGRAGTITSLSATSLTVRAPASAAAGAVPIVLTYWLGTSGASATVAAGSYTYVAAVVDASAPRVVRVSPRSGPPEGGGPLTVVGRHFTGATAVTVDGVAVPFRVDSDRSLTITAMPVMTFDRPIVRVVVSNSRGSSRSVGRSAVYRYVAPVPVVRAMTPRRGSPLGGTVTLKGAGFPDVTSVAVGGAPVRFTILGPSVMTVQIPALPEGRTRGSVMVTPSTRFVTGRGKAFVYQVPTPSIRLSPAAGPSGGGTTVRVTGRHLAEVTQVLFGGASVVFARQPDGSLTFTVPARVGVDAAWSVSVRVKNPWRTSEAVEFQYRG